jgi:hypothetical protein
MVTIERIGTDKCQFSNKENAEGVYCKFTDGSFEGFLSWASLKKLIAWKSNPKPPQGQKK